MFTPPDKDPRSDHELIDAINRGDRPAFEALYLRYRHWVTALAYRFTGDREIAMDVLQETFAYVLSKFPGFTLTCQFKSFLYPAVRHTAIALRRKASRYQSHADPEPEAATGKSYVPGRSVDRQELTDIMASLSEEHRETVLLRFMDDLSLQEIADATGVPVGTVKSRLHHALNALREDPRTRNYFDR